MHLQVLAFQTATILIIDLVRVTVSTAQVRSRKVYMALYVLLTAKQETSGLNYIGPELIGLAWVTGFALAGEAFF